MLSESYHKDMNKLGKSAPSGLSKIFDSSSLDNPFLKCKFQKEPFGFGAFSQVHKGIDENGDEVAVKRIKLSDLAKEFRGNISKFERELHVLTSINHPNIMNCICVYKTSHYWNIVCEYCNYGTLADQISVLKKIKNYNERELIVKDYMSQLKSALKYLHEMNIIHRDLKPHNILLMKDKDGIITIKLADFTFAREFDDDAIDHAGFSDDINSICGTPWYMAPEILFPDSSYNIKADLWSFGVILYELLYGQNPYKFFTGKGKANREILIEAIRTKEVVYPDYYSKECIDLLKHLLNPDAATRIDWNTFLNNKWFNREKEVDSFNVLVSEKFSPGSYIDDKLAIHLDETHTNKIHSIKQRDIESEYDSDQEMFDCEIDSTASIKPVVVTNKKTSKSSVNIVEDHFAYTEEHDVFNPKGINIEYPDDDFIVVNKDKLRQEQYMSRTGSVFIEILARSMNRLIGWPSQSV